MDAAELERAVGAVLVPEVRASGTRPGDPGHQDLRPTAAYLRRYPPAGVVVFGRSSAGPRDPTALLAGVRADLAAAGEPPCFAACDLEQGAGLHLPGATRLPPAQALAAAAAGERRGEQRGLDWIRTAGAITAREARERGIELVLAPVADVNAHGANPIVAVRSFGDEPTLVAARACAFHQGLRAGGAAGCAKHYPGHGDVRVDSHVTLPLVPRAFDQLEGGDLVPFRALVQERVACVMVGHLDVPALTGEPGLPATLSRAAIEGVLRERLGFCGVVLSDAMDMGALAGIPKAHARALAAGCDGLLGPRDPDAAATELLAAVRMGELDAARLRQAAQRMRTLRDGLRALEPQPAQARILPAGLCEATPAERARFASTSAAAALCLSMRRWPWRRGRRCEVLAPLHQARSQEARAALERLRRALAGSPRPAGVVLPVVVELHAGSGRYGPGRDELEQVRSKVGALQALGWPVGLVWLGSVQTLPAAWWGREDLPVLLAHAPTPPMVEAVGGWLAGTVDHAGCLPCGLG